MSAEVEALIVGAITHAEGAVLQTTAHALLQQAALREDDFTDARARVAWRCFTKLVERRRPCNLETVVPFMRTARVLSNESLAWFMAASEGALMVGRDQFGDLVDAIRSQARARALALALEEWLPKLRSPEPDLVAAHHAIAAATSAAAASMAEETSRGDLDLAELGEQWDRRELGDEASDLVPTGIAPLDELIGGFFPNLNMIIGAPSEGKSAFVATVIGHLIANGVKVGLVGLEDGTQWLLRRHIARLMQWNVRDVGRKKRDHAGSEAWGNAAASLVDPLKNLYTFRRREGQPVPMSKVLQVSERWRSADGVRIVFVDHGGEVDHMSNVTGGDEQHRLKVGMSYKHARDYSVSTGLPLVFVAHTRRRRDDDVEPRPPRADEVRDASDIENAARLILGVWQVPGEGFTRITSAKVTEGARYKTVKLAQVGGGMLLDPDGAEVVDLFAEKMAKAKAKKQERDAERAEALARRAAEKQAAAEAKAAKKPQRAMFGGDS